MNQQATATTEFLKPSHGQNSNHSAKVGGIEGW
jgi:hypothetical protein